MENLIYPDFLFETSWEVCNKVGGINTVIITKAKMIRETLGDNYILIGPDIHHGNMIADFDETEEFDEFRQFSRGVGMRTRIGRWKQADNAITVLIDFNFLVERQNDILKELWDEYRVDSLSGQWEYIEPVLFGYAAGIFIKKLADNIHKDKKNITAHFHEWMTGSGALMLKKYAPTVSTAFTTHATIMGRTIAGNNMPLYGEMANYDTEALSTTLNIRAKYSMEKTVAAEADAFSTVSDVTRRECEDLLHAAVDIVTPNGFNTDFVWKNGELKKKQQAAQAKLIEVAENYLGKKYDKVPFIVGTSGRYEVRNKGIDVFINALKQIAEQYNLDREILAYIMVPAGNHGVRDYTNRNDGMIPNVTHYLTNYLDDAVVNMIKDSLVADNRSKVQVMFVPAYIDENDGLFDMSYYEVLCGMHQTVYASYYEPWGYTPLESIAFGVPTVTTTLAGFGLWIKDHFEDHPSVDVIERTDDNKEYVALKISEAISKVMNTPADKYKELSKDAQKISRNIVWERFIKYYWELYSTAIAHDVKTVLYDIKDVHIRGENEENKPKWRRIMIEREIPQRLKKLEELAHNLWSSWNDGDELLRYMDKDVWARCGKNPVNVLHCIDYTRLLELEKDTVFLEMLDNQYDRFKTYMNRPYDKKEPSIAYFSMEYGLVNYLKIYSGGLGILAGDYLKEASDKNVDMVAVGLMYKYGYFTQKISASGEQEEFYEPENFQRLPIAPVRDESGRWLGVSVPFPGRNVEAKIWLCEVGKTKLYLLDTDHEGNLVEDRNITHQLYGGNWEHRLKQEKILGFGGIKALNKLDIKTDVYHCNEGHAAFIGIERIKDLIEEHQLSFDEAKEVVYSSSLFTTHTPVPAGHDAFSVEMIKHYMADAPEKLNITWRRFLELGMADPDDPNEKFSMSYLACTLSQEINGVSKLHGEVSKYILSEKWPGYFPSELHIDYVTNGVHYPTWSTWETKKIYDEAYGKGAMEENYLKTDWKNIYHIDDSKIWSKRLLQKEVLIEVIKKRLSDPKQFRFDSPRQLVQVRDSLKTDVLTIGYARRFATYKRAMLLFDNLDRLDKIVNNPERPVQILFAGKAHPNDIPGQDLIKKIVNIASMPQFVGKILFLQNYDMVLAKRMISGVDVWLNTPERTLEASGTSGEKACINGVLHFSVLDGWWVEGYVEGAGWALPQEATFENPEHQNQVDSEMIYNIIEEQIVPLYYDRNKKNVPEKWVGSIKKCICDIASRFNTRRMLQDYEDQFYYKLANSHRQMTAHDFAKARELASWKEHVRHEWKNIEVLKVTQYDIFKGGIKEGDTYRTEVEVKMGSLTPKDVGVEIVMARQIANGNVDVIRTIPFDFVEQHDDVAIYNKEFKLENNGTYDLAIRLYADNPLLAYRMDFGLVKWL